MHITSTQNIINTLLQNLIVRQILIHQILSHHPINSLAYPHSSAYSTAFRELYIKSSRSKTFIISCCTLIIFLQKISHIKSERSLTIEPGKRGGKPCIRRMRITVYDVLGWLAAGMSHAEIMDDFPELTEEDIRACLEFAADREHRIRLS